MVDRGGHRAPEDFRVTSGNIELSLLPAHTAQQTQLDAAQSVLHASCDATHPSQDACARITWAREEADRLVGLGGGMAETAFAAGALASLVAAGLLPHAAVATVAQELHEQGVDLVAVGLSALRDPGLLVLPLEDFLDATLALLEALGPLHAPSIWVPAGGAGPRLLRWRSQVPSPDVPGLVRDVLVGEGAATHDNWTALVVRSFQRPSAALAFRVDDGGAQPAAALAAALGRLLSRALERARLFAASAEQAATLVRSSERRMTRIGLDLHDGPLQEVVLLSYELTGLRATVASRDPGTPATDALLARIDDLEALTACLDDNLRQVAHSLDAPGQMRRPFEPALSGIVRGFGVRTGIEPDVQVTGDIDGLSDSQRGALLRIVQECLTNVRLHSRAQNVQVLVTAGATQVDAVIKDDGVGFDVEPALRESARRGRMGLLGIVERVRLLGGLCDIRSRPGEGCCISLTVARWTSEMAAMAALDTDQPLSSTAGPISRQDCGGS